MKEMESKIPAQPLGPIFFSSGGTLEEIFTELWPDNEFKIARKFGEDVFTLRINTSTPLDQAILSQIWNQFDQHADFVGTESSSSRTGNCLEVNSQAQLDTYGYIPSNGVLKRDESNKSEIELDGYTLSELARKLGQNRRLGAFYVQQKSTSSVYSFRLDASSMDTLKESLKAHGIVMKPCSRSISVYELR